MVSLGHNELTGSQAVLQMIFVKWVLGGTADDLAHYWHYVSYNEWTHPYKIFLMLQSKLKHKQVRREKCYNDVNNNKKT